MVNKVKEYLKTQGINAYQTEDIPDVCLDEGIVFNDFDLFYSFIKNNNITWRNVREDHTVHGCILLLCILLLTN